MAQRGNRLDKNKFCCSICLDLLKDPATLSCGHSYCMNCINSHWDRQDERMIYSCPQCREAFRPRPKLVKSTVLADLVEELKNPGLQASPDDHCYAGAEDVACDVCSGRKRKSLKSCVVCLASYCEEHLQPHYQSPPFKKHKLVEPSKNLQENICPRHNKVKDIFCRTDQQCICYLCSVDQHKDHNTVSASAETKEKQRELELSLKETQQRLQDRGNDEKVLGKKVKAANLSADKALKDTDKIFAEMMNLLQKRNSEVRHQIRSQLRSEVSRVKDIQEKLQREITELKKREHELKQLLNSDDHNQLLLNYRSLSALSPPTPSSSINVRPLRYFEDVTAAVAKVRGQLQDVLTETWTNTYRRLLPQPEPKTRAEFLRYSQDITLDPNTAHERLLLSEGNRKVTLMWENQSYSSHTDRFADYSQVLWKEGVTRRCYWEVKWLGEGAVGVAMTYKNIGRSGRSEECEFGFTDRSWMLYCLNNSCYFYHRGTKTKVSDVDVSRVGVYLDHAAGLLSFYRVSPDTMTHLHRVQTTFTKPLYAGVGLYFPGDTAELCKLK